MLGLMAISGLLWRLREGNWRKVIMEGITATEGTIMGAKSIANHPNIHNHHLPTNSQMKSPHYNKILSNQKK